MEEALKLATRSDIDNPEQHAESKRHYKRNLHVSRERHR